MQSASRGNSWPPWEALLRVQHPYCNRFWISQHSYCKDGDFLRNSAVSHPESDCFLLWLFLPCCGLHHLNQEGWLLQHDWSPCLCPCSFSRPTSTPEPAFLLTKNFSLTGFSWAPPSPGLLTLPPKSPILGRIQPSRSSQHPSPDICSLPVPMGFPVPHSPPGEV